MIFEWNIPSGDGLMPKDGTSCLLLLRPEEPYNSGSIVSGVFREAIGGWIVDHTNYIYTFYSVDRWMPNPFMRDSVYDKYVNTSLKVAQFEGNVNDLFNGLIGKYNVE